MAKDFRVRVHEDNPRAELFQEVFGRLEVCVQSPVPVRVRIEGQGEHSAYMLDLALISGDERRRLMDSLSRRFNVPMSEMAEALETYGVPILAEGVTLVVEHPQRWID